MRRTPLALILLLVACSAQDTSPDNLPPDQVAVTDGMRVSGSGLIVAVPDQPVRFCGSPIVNDPDPDPTPVSCEFGIDLVGLDLVTLTNARTRDGSTEGFATVTGVVGDGVLTVEQQGPPSRSERPEAEGQPCPEPSGGWPQGNLTPEGGKVFNTYVGTHQEQVSWLRLLKPTESSQIMVLSVQDDDERAEAERLLRPTLGDALCLLHARVSRAELAAVEQDPDLGLDGPVYLVGTGQDTDLQPVRTVSTVLVTPELRAAADQHPPGLVVFQPDLVPV